MRTHRLILAGRKGIADYVADVVGAAVAGAACPAVYDQIASGHRVDLRDDRCRPNLVATATVAQVRALGSTNRPNGAM
jgi:hypothetical protein